MNHFWTIRKHWSFLVPPEVAPISLQGLQQLGKVAFGSISGSEVIPEKEAVNKQAERASAGPAWSPRTEEWGWPASRLLPGCFQTAAAAAAAWKQPGSSSRHAGICCFSLSANMQLFSRQTEDAFVSAFCHLGNCLGHFVSRTPDNWTLQETFPQWQRCNNHVKLSWTSKCIILFSKSVFQKCYSHLIFSALTNSLCLPPIIPVSPILFLEVCLTLFCMEKTCSEIMIILHLNIKYEWMKNDPISKPPAVVATFSIRKAEITLR